MVHSLGRLKARPAVLRLLRALPACFAAIIPIHLIAAEIRGVVVDAMGGEPLARVRIELLNTELRTTTDPQGHFTFASVPAGNYTLHVETVGYRLLNREFSLSQDEAKEFQIVLSPETFRRTDTINVTADPFGATEAASPAELALTGNEVETLSSVLAADPLRAVQSLPGVAATNDFYSQFSVLGAPYSRIGFYLDDALLHSPFHTAQEISDGASLSVLNGDMIEAMSLFPVAFPARYGDRTGSALDVRTRDGSRTRPSVRISAGVSSLTGLAEGPLPRKRGSWMVAARKSYLEYILRRITNDASLLAVGFNDAQAKVSYELTPRGNISLHVIDGHSSYDRAHPEQVGIFTLVNGAYHFTLAKVNWRYVAGDRLLLAATAAYMRERFENLNRDRRDLAAGYYGEWLGNASAAWSWTSNATLEAGWSARRLRDTGFENRFLNPFARLIDVHDGTALRQGGWVQQTWHALNGRLRLSAGTRADTHELSPVHPVSPQASVGYRITSATELQLGWGQYVEFPELAVLTAPAGGVRLRPERSTHYVAAIERRFGERTRLRVEAYDRDDRDLVARPFLDTRLVNGAIIFPSMLPLYYNSVRGYTRGIQVMAQRRTANRVSGWVSYTLGYARERDGLEQTHYWSPDDQRHLVNAFLAYRFAPSFHLSGKWVYASGAPIPGFFRPEGRGQFFIASLRDDVRLDAYERLDLRADKSFTYDRWKLTLYGELINALDHSNLRVAILNGVDPRTGRAFLAIDRGLPILPAAGVTLEF